MKLWLRFQRIKRCRSENDNGLRCIGILGALLLALSIILNSLQEQCFPLAYIQASAPSACLSPSSVTLGFIA